MNVSVVLTTINSLDQIKPIEDTCKELNWELVVVQDKKSIPGQSDYATVLTVEDQNKMEYLTVGRMPYDDYARKNIGYLYAWHNGADYIISTDDDNYPISAQLWQNAVNAFSTPCIEEISNDEGIYWNPLPSFTDADFTDVNPIWPRGLPLSCVDNSFTWPYNNEDNEDIEIGVVAGLWNGSPDFDVLGHVMYDHIDWKFEQNRVVKAPRHMAPYNTQNTIFNRRTLPFQFIPQGLLRANDIWTSYMAQVIFDLMNISVLYIEPTVTQIRNPHDYSKDARHEARVLFETERVFKDIMDIRDTIYINRTEPFNNIEAYIAYILLTQAASKYFYPEYFEDVTAWLTDLGVLNDMSYYRRAGFIG
jgi:hypothetical protein